MGYRDPVNVVNKARRDQPTVGSMDELQPTVVGE
jgi:hypothetical protein